MDTVDEEVECDVVEVSFDVEVDVGTTVNVDDIVELAVDLEDKDEEDGKVVEV